MSSSLLAIVIVILDDSLTTFVPLNQVTTGFGFALHLHFIVMSVPDSLGMILGFSTNEGAKPVPLSPPRICKFSNEKSCTTGEYDAILFN